MLKIDLLIKNASQVLTCEENAKDFIGKLNDVSIGIKDEKIVFIGNGKELEKNIDYKNAKIIDGSGKVVLPGFVDSHTHLIFGGSRVDQYSASLTIDSIDEIHALGIKTGLEASMELTHSISEDKLYEESLSKVNRMIENGTTTIEMKSGYGLDFDNEIKQLKVINRLKEESNVDVISTYLGAHGWPKDMDKNDYIDFMIEKVIPYVGENNLADACDIWVDEGYYTKEDAKKILSVGEEYGMRPMMHADCYSYIGGTDLVVEMDMMSAGHLNYTPLESIKNMAKAKIPGILLPGTDFSVKHHKPFNPRPMIEEGMILALATNLNPGNWIESMQVIIQLACRLHKMTPEEAIRAATYGGACALEMEDRVGSLEIGKQADIQIWDTDDYRNVAYQIGVNQVEKVIKKGNLIVE